MMQAQLGGPSHQINASTLPSAIPSLSPSSPHLFSAPNLEHCLSFIFSCLVTHPPFWIQFKANLLQEAFSDR